MTRHSEDVTGEQRGDRVAATGLDRRTLLGGIAAGAAGLAGCNALESDRDPGPVAEDHEWTPADPPLATPWFEDVDPENPRSEYPRPQLVRDRWRHLNGVWGFETVDELGEPPTDRQLADGVLVPFPVVSALSGINRRVDRMWYRRTFEIPEDWDVRGDERLLLHFEAIDYEATVYVNGTRVGDHVGGYDHFVVDVTDAISEARRQELVVGVVDETEPGQPLGKQHPNDGAIWYTPASGIWQTVWMEPVAEAHVTGLDTTPHLADERLLVTVAASAAANDLTVVATASADGEQVASATGAPGEELSLSIPDPRTWSPEDPFLYDLEIQLRDGDRTADTVESYFGMRSIGSERIDGHRRTTLNGEVSFPLATLDQGYWPDGIYTAPTDEAQVFDLEQHLKLGFNTVRKHVKVEPRRWYYHADRLGLLVHQDMPSANDFEATTPPADREQFERELRAMIDQLGNHPSITTWIPFNEGWGLYDTERITAMVAQRDPTRRVNANSGANVGGRDCGCGDILDWHNYPGPGAAPPADERISVIGEFGGMGLGIDGHWWGSGSFSYDTYVTAAGYTSAYVRKLERMRLLATKCGLSSAVFTQLTDVETENNGLLTYDRKVVKPDVDRVRSVNEALIEAATAVGGASDGGGEPALAAHWPLDDIADGVVATDTVGDNDAELVGDPQSTDGRVGGALAVDGGFAATDEGVLATLGAYSVAAWVRLDERGSSRTAVSQDGERTSAFSLGYDGDADRFVFAAQDRDAVDDPSRVVSDSRPETGRWYHLTGVRDVGEGTIRLYVDGERVGQASFCPGFDATGATVLGRGQSNGVGASFWSGAIDDVRAFDGALSDDAVAALID